MRRDVNTMKNDDLQELDRMLAHHPDAIVDGALLAFAGALLATAGRLQVAAVNVKQGNTELAIKTVQDASAQLDEIRNRISSSIDLAQKIIVVMERLAKEARE